MTSQDFVIWMKGFAAAANDFTLTPKQWDDLKDQLNKVDDYGESLEELENNFFGDWEETPGTFRDHTGQSYPPYWSPQSPFFTTSGTSGSIDTRSIVSQWAATPNNITYTVTSGSSFIGAGSTYTHTYPNGTTVVYTAGGANENEFSNPTNKELLHD